MKIRVRELRSLIREALNPVGGWEYFHITAIDRGTTITLTPQIPTNASDRAYDEDFTTPRVCLAASVDDAIIGRFGSLIMNQPEMFVYAAKDIKVVTPRKSPFSDQTSNWQDYAKANDLDADSETERARVLKFCIPDVENTREVWSLVPTRMTLIGRLWVDSNDRIKRKWFLKQTVDLE